MVSTLERLWNCARKRSGGASFVTAEGDYLHPDGAISGGTAQPGVLERKREIENLKIVIGDLQNEIDKLTLEIEVGRTRDRELQFRNKGSMRASLSRPTSCDAETRKDILNFKNNLEKLDRRIEIINQNLKKTGYRDRRKARQLMDETRAKITRLDWEKSVLEQRFGEVEVKIKKAEEEERSVEREIAEKKVKCASLSKRKKAS